MADANRDPFTNINIARYFNGKSIFITGGTGFIGKVVVEKLLRTCPDLKNIYFYIRPKKGFTCQERLDKLFSLPLFKTMQEMNPNAKDKVIPIPGDITHKSLGISDEHRKMMANNVDIIIHSAATVKFNEPIRIAMEMNVIAVIEVIQLAKEMKHLEVFCHISTAYSQCDCSKNEEIIEKFYPVKVEADKIIEAMGWMSDEMLNSFTTSLIGTFPNTYTFTKSLAEHLLKNEPSLPLVIVRPSIVSSSVADPFPGWVDNYNGVSGIMVAVGRGVVRSLHAPSIKHDIVPVDLVSNCIIVSTWYKGVSRSSNPIICNCTSGNVNPTSFVDMQKYVLPIFSHDYPLNNIFRRPNFSFHSSRIINRYWQWISHYMPAIILDGLTLLVGRKPRFVNIYKMIDSNMDTLDFFIQNEWKWGNVQFLRILKAIPEEDKEKFDFDMRKIDWKNYYQDMTIGVKRYLVKDDMQELPKARNVHRRYKIVRWLSSTIFILLSGRFFFLKSERFRKLWFEALFAIYRFLQYFRITSINV